MVIRYTRFVWKVNNEGCYVSYEQMMIGLVWFDFMAYQPL